MAKVHRGIVLYSIEKDGCLNGVYANEQPPDAGIIFNEMARKIQKTVTKGKDPIEGVYECSYFETDSARRDVQLKIDGRSPAANVFDVLWIDPVTSLPIFEGVGYKMNERQFAVHYKSK